MPRRCALTGLAATLAVLVLSGCSAGAAQDPPAAAPSAAPGPSGSGTPGPPSVDASPSAATSPAPGPRVIAVQVAGGKVSGVESRVPAALGEQLVLRVTSDVADEVHVHGYDIRAAVPAGGTVDIPLAATIPGSVEVELHKRHQTLFQLRVS